jgi:archaeosortase B (VPXXXP-CTERM-specific)
VSKKSKRNDNQNQKPRPSGRGFSAKPGKKPSPGRFTLFWTRNRRVIIPALTFFVIVGIFIFAYYRLVDGRPFHGFMVVTADVTGFLLNLTGRGVVTQDTLVSSSQFSFQIVDLCTAVMPMLILTAAVLAFPSRIKEKAFGLLVGLPGIFIVNQVRLVSLFFIGAYAPGIFETAHLLVWQSLMILLAIGLWLIWVYKYVRSPVI